MAIDESAASSRMAQVRRARENETSERQTSHPCLGIYLRKACISKTITYINDP